MRAEFSEKIKRTLAGRVGYMCSFPGCSQLTIGPQKSNDSEVSILGEAAHIYAASPNGPRNNPNLSAQQLSSIENGIWMCRHHARLIDTDYTSYSASTLINWKLLAEERAHSKIEHLGTHQAELGLTYVAIGRSIVFEGKWASAMDDSWSFAIQRFIYGTVEEVKELSTQQPATHPEYIIIESQGDGREIIDKFGWRLNDNNLYEIVLNVKAKEPRINPNQMGYDLALDEETGDLLIADGDLQMITGIRLAKQYIKSSLASDFGDWTQIPSLGSNLRKYFKDFKTHPDVLNRLLKLDLSRLISIPIQDSVSSHSPKPPLNFINRVIEAEVLSVNILNHQIPIRLKLEFGGGEIWRTL